MDNARPIPFLHDPERPELTYSVGFSISPSVQQKLDDFEPSIIHITVPDCTSLHVIQYARRKEIPIMGTYHSNIPEYMEHYPGLSWLKHILATFFRHQYSFIQALYVPTPYIQKHLEDNYQMDRCTTMHVWGRGVDTDAFNPAHRSFKYRHALGVADDTPIVLWVGRLVPEKRPDIFATVIRRLHERGIRYHALVVGAGPCEDVIASLPNTTFAGWLNADQLSTVYASSDVFLFPSAVETFGNVTLEAAASGLPVVVEAGCSGHLVHDGENGYTCEAGDIDAFYEATLSLVADPVMREEFSAAGRDLGMTLEKRSVVRRMLENYSTVTEQFFTEYGGHHCARDAVYQAKHDAFRGGNHPRPLIFVMIEWLFITVFGIVFNLTAALMWLHDFFYTAPSSGYRSVELESQGSPTSTPIPSPPASPALRKKACPPSSAASPGSSINIIELDDVEIGSPRLDPLLASDDRTTTTDGSSHEMSAASSVSALGDCALSHTLARGFVSCIEFQCRMESRVRNSCAACCRLPSSSTFTGSAKRKNSSMTAPPVDQTVSRCRIDASDLVAIQMSPEDGTSSPVKEGQRSILRRTQSIVDVY
jgi:glycosyltransferase involved in cell wall biosynthesis